MKTLKDILICFWAGITSRVFLLINAFFTLPLFVGVGISMLPSPYEGYCLAGIGLFLVFAFIVGLGAYVKMDECIEKLEDILEDKE